MYTPMTFLILSDKYRAESPRLYVTLSQLFTSLTLTEEWCNMLPRLTNIPQLSPLVSDYLDALRLQHFEGDIASNYADRLSLATDNSVYQQFPQAILFPKSVADVVRLTKLAQQGK